jgi:hypothetical protein
MHLWVLCLLLVTCATACPQPLAKTPAGPLPSTNETASLLHRHCRASIAREMHRDKGASKGHTLQPCVPFRRCCRRGCRICCCSQSLHLHCLVSEPGVRQCYCNLRCRSSHSFAKVVFLASRRSTLKSLGCAKHANETKANKRCIKQLCFKAHSIVHQRRARAELKFESLMQIVTAS